MICDRPDIAEKLVPFVEGALGEPDKTEVAGHLRRCQACQEEARLVKESILTLKAAVRTGIWKEAGEHISPDLLSMHFEDERAREAGFLPGSGLTDAQAKDIRIHLAECSDCREELVLLRELESEPIGELAAGTQPLPRALRLEIERLYPVQAATQRAQGERTLSLADRLMAWINPKSLVMASLCVVALTFSYALTRSSDAPPTAMAPTSTSTEVAMLDKEETSAAKPRKTQSKLNELSELDGKLEKNREPALGQKDVDKKVKDDERRAPVASKPAAREEQPAAEPEPKQVGSQVRTASVDDAPRPAPAAAAPERPKVAPSQQKPAAVAATRPKPPERPRTVVSTATSTTEKPALAVNPPAPPAGDQAADELAGRDDAPDAGVIAAEPQVVASAPTGGVANAMTRVDNAPNSEVAVSPNASPAPVQAAGAAPPSKISVPASAPNTGTRTTPVGQNRTAVKPPAPVSVPVRSLPGEGEGYAAAQAPPTSPAQKAQTQSLNRAADGVRGPEPLAMNRQADLGPRAKAVARQFSSNASVLVEEHSDGSVTVTVRPDRSLTSEEKDKLRRMLRSNLNLGDNDTISIRQ